MCTNWPSEVLTSDYLAFWITPLLYYISDLTTTALTKDRQVFPIFETLSSLLRP